MPEVRGWMSRRSPRLRGHLGHGRSHSVAIDPQLPQHAGARTPAFGDERQKEVLGADAIGFHPFRFPDGRLHDSPCVRVEGDVRRGVVFPGRAHRFDPAPDLITDAEEPEDRRTERLHLRNEPKKQVARIDLNVMQASRLLLRRHDGLPGGVIESLEHDWRGYSR